MAQLKLNYKLCHTSNFTLTEIENMLPYELEIYINLFLEDMQKQNERSGT